MLYYFLRLFFIKYLSTSLVPKGSKSAYNLGDKQDA